MASSLSCGGLQVHRVVATLAGAVLALSACTGGATDPAGADGQSPVAPSSTEASPNEVPEPTGPEQTGPEPAEDTIGPIAPAEPTATEAPGSIGSRDLPTADVGATVAIDRGIEFQVAGLRDVRIEADGPGEVAGPGVVARIVVANDSGSGVDLDGVAVNLEFGDDPGIPSFGPQTKPFEGILAPGRTARAEYAFLRPEGSRGDTVVRIEYNNSENVVVVRS